MSSLRQQMKFYVAQRLNSLPGASALFFVSLMVALAYTLYHRFCSQRRVDDGPSPDSSSRSLNLSVVAVPDHGRSPPPYASTTALLLPPAGRPHSLPVFMVPPPSL